MTEGPVAFEHLTARIKERMQQARQACPFFQLEQRAVDSAVPSPLDLERLQTQLVLPELSHSGMNTPLAWSFAQQQEICQELPAWIVNCDSSFFGGSPDGLAALRKADPQRYLIARDLVMDEYQILQARVAGANALVLSNALLGTRRAQLYTGKTRFWEMEPLLEIHQLEDVRLALELKLRLVVLADPPARIPGQPAWTPEDLAEACRLLKSSRVMMYAGLDAGRLKDLAAAGVSLVTPGWQLWQSADPAAVLTSLEAPLIGA